MTGSPCIGGALAVVLTYGTLYAMPLLAEESAPRPPEIKPLQPTAPAPKTQEVNPPETVPPELKQEPKTKESTTEPGPAKPVRSLILTVKLALLGDQRTAPCTIEIDTKGQDVVLSGKVSSEADKLAAAEVARQVEGVKSVVNKLDVVKELSQGMMQKRDQGMTEYIRERFKKSVTLEAAKFDIKTENGVVELSGKTRFQVIVLEAAETALQVPGVKAVKTTAVQIEGAE